MEKIDISELNKESRIILFLKESKNIKEREELNKLWVRYKLNERSNSINLRVIERLIGEYSKYSKEKKELKNKIFREELISKKIDYSEIINLYKRVKENSKRSNRIKSLEIDIEV